MIRRVRQIAQRGEQVAARILANNEGGGAHPRGLLQLAEEARLRPHGTLAAQVGSHTVYIPLFVKGGDLIRDAWVSRNRKVMIDALNYARRPTARKNSVPWLRFSKFWRFIIPDHTMAWVPPGWGTAPDAAVPATTSLALKRSIAAMISARASAASVQPSTLTNLPGSRSL